jgi:glutathione S-transferase
LARIRYRDKAHPAGGDFGNKDTPEFLAMNPHGRVPVIDDGGAIVWESQMILRYLAAKYARGRFWSDDPAERSFAERWMDWSRDLPPLAAANGALARRSPRLRSAPDGLYC